MKVLVLGLDGFEPTVAQELKLNVFNQYEHNLLQVPINKKLNVPTSPEVWASFLTGEVLEKEFVYRYPALNKIFFKLFKKTFSQRRFPQLNTQTFLDKVNGIAINVPYTKKYDNTFFDSDSSVLGALHKLGTGLTSLESTIIRLEALYQTRKAYILTECWKHRSSNFIFAYLHFPDVLEHCYTDHSDVEALYRDLAIFVSVLKKRLGERTYIIIADHGFDFEKKTHTNMGFYSSNISLGKIKKITDFYNLFIQLNKETLQKATGAS